MRPPPAAWPFAPSSLQLLHRIPDYYMHVTIIDELPIELQNWLTISDKVRRAPPLSQ